jgi:hypothetical protein
MYAYNQVRSIIHESLLEPPRHDRGVALNNFHLKMRAAMKAEEDRQYLEHDFMNERRFRAPKVQSP